MTDKQEKEIIDWGLSVLYGSVMAILMYIVFAVMFSITYKVDIHKEDVGIILIVVLFILFTHSCYCWRKIDSCYLESKDEK